MILAVSASTESLGASFKRCMLGDAFLRGGATVLKVGGTNSASEASRKIFFDPPAF